MILVPGLGDLRAGYRFLAPNLAGSGLPGACTDLRGHGDSDATFTSYGDEETAGDVIALIEELGGPAVVVGNSMGAGSAVLAAAQRCPGQRQRQVLARRAAPAARVAPLGGIAAASMRQATRRAERHVAQLLAKIRKSARLGAARHMIAAGLAAVGAMITRYRDGGRFTTDDEVARITVALRDLRVRDDAWARMDPAHSAAHQRLWIERGPAGLAPPRGRARSPPRLGEQSLASGHGAYRCRRQPGSAFNARAFRCCCSLYGRTWLGRCASARPVKGTGRDGSAGRGSADR